MTDNKPNAAGGAIGFFGALFLVFLVLKLCHVVDWSWWTVTAPLWAPGAFALTIIVLGFPVYLLVHWLAERRADRRAERLYLERHPGPIARRGRR